MSLAYERGLAHRPGNSLPAELAFVGAKGALRLGSGQ
jgi:hypothetical protein